MQPKSRLTLLALAAPLALVAAQASAKGWDHEGLRDAQIKLVLLGADTSAASGKCDVENLAAVVADSATRDPNFVTELKKAGDKQLTKQGHDCLGEVIAKASAK